MSNMRGLAVFISELRNSRARDSEEKRVNTELAKIRAKFRDVKLSGYDRKKYVCKLLYMYILGWHVDFGHLETVSLISSSKYSEKQIGYLGVTLFLNEHHELLHLVVNSMRNDLLHSDELFNCLALHCIANVGGKEMGVALADHVHQLLVSNTTKAFVRKKAGLTLLRIYRKAPEIIDRQWAPRLISLVSDPDSGVVLSIMSLITELALDHSELYSSAYHRAVLRLQSIVIKTEYSSDDKYYSVPCPWLQIKLMRFLLIYPTTTDQALCTILTDILEQLLSSKRELTKNVQQTNAQNAVIYQAISLAMHLSFKHEFDNEIMVLLSQFLQSKETNVRYLGLEILSRLTRRPDSSDMLHQHRQAISQSLRDRDVSVRRRALDLLYSMCGPDSAKDTIHELLRYLQTSDHAIKGELVLKIAVLVEKYATEHAWYLSVTLQLLAMAGDHVADEVWQRVVQIVTNNENLQEVAARSLLAYLKSPTCHETIVKIGGIVLGEFGHLIANEPACLPIDQFSVLHAKFNISTASTRAILLSTYIKFLNIFPEIAAEILLVFRKFQEILDTELQQRACEYLVLAQEFPESLLQTICEEMPPYPLTSSKLISKLYGGNSEVLDSTSPGLIDSAPDIVPLPAVETKGIHFTPNWEAGYGRLSWKDQGVLFEDRQIRIIMRCIFPDAAQDIHLVIVFDNKSGTDFTSFSSTIDIGEPHSLLLQSVELAPSILPSKSQVQQSTDIRCCRAYTSAPSIKISYFAGALQEVVLRMPIHLDKFLMPSLEADPLLFEERWRQLDAPQLESSQVIDVPYGERARILSRLIKVLLGHRWTLLKQVDEDADILKGAAILRLHQSKSIGCLIEARSQDKWRSITIKIRASVISVAAVLQSNLAVNLPYLLLEQ